jgi:alpha-glucuronidase
MMFTQPPVSSVAVFIGARRYANDHPRSPEYQIVSNSRGVTLGDIFDNIQERATTPYLRDAPFCIAVLKLCSYERAYSANFYAFIRYRGPQKS